MDGARDAKLGRPTQIRDFSVPVDVTSVRFLGSPIRLQPTPLNGFLRKIRRSG